MYAIRSYYECFETVQCFSQVGDFAQCLDIGDEFLADPQRARAFAGQLLLEFIQHLAQCHGDRLAALEVDIADFVEIAARLVDVFVNFP